MHLYLAHSPSLTIVSTEIVLGAENACAISGKLPGAVLTGVLKALHYPFIVASTLRCEGSAVINAYGSNRFAPAA
jgi:hypothetical protein